jgi:hypothetical protein
MIFKPPANIAKRIQENLSVFLAGSIEMNRAIDWQTDLGNWFDANGYNVFNPRRDDWDASWVQDYENPQFSQQVHWELNALKKSDLIVMHFVPETISPISLMEFGMFSESGKMKVICPKGYFRKGNVEIVCSLCNIPLFDTIEQFKESVI